MPATKPSLKPASPCAVLTIPELEHAKAAALGTLVSLHSRRAYKNAIDKFITGGGVLPAGFQILAPLSQPQLENALTQLSGELGTGAQLSGFQLMNEFENLPSPENPARCPGWDRRPIPLPTRITAGIPVSLLFPATDSCAPNSSGREPRCRTKTEPGLDW